MGAAQRGQRLGCGHGVCHQLLNGDGFIPNLVNKRAVGTVLQQAAHQVGQQGLVRAYGRINAAGAGQLAVGGIAHHFFVQAFAHAVQALKLVLAPVIVVASHVVNAGQCVGVVCGELREDGLRCTQQLAGAGQV